MISIEENPDSQSMRELATGRDSALNELMDRHSEKLFRFLVRLLQNETDAEEITQESFVRVYWNRAKFRQGEKFTTWLYTIASNLAKDQFRRNNRRQLISLDQTGDSNEENLHEAIPAKEPGPSERMQETEASDAVQKAVGMLPEDLRTPLVLFHYEGIGQEDIGKILGCSRKAVEMKVYRAKQALREILSSDPTFSEGLVDSERRI